MSIETNTSNKRIVINLISNIVSFSSTLLISLVLTPFLINTLGKETYSFFPLANNFVSYMTIVTNALNSMANRFITIEIAKKNNEKANMYFSSVFYSNLILSAILFIIMFFIVVFLDKILDIPINMVASIKILFSFVFASMIVNVVTSVFGVATFAKNRIDLRAMRELFAAICRIVLYILFFVFLPPSIIYVGIVALIIAIINFVIQFIFTKKLLPEISFSAKSYSFMAIKELLFSGMWNSVSNLGNILLCGVNLLLINILYGANSAGNYSIVQTVPTFINGTISMLTGVFVPIITYKFAEQNKIELIAVLRKSQKVIGILTCSVIAVFIGLSIPFFRLWTPKENAVYLMVLTIIVIFPHIFVSTLWPVFNLDIVMNEVKMPSIVMLLLGIINVVIALIFKKLFNFQMEIIPIVSSLLFIFWIAIYIPVYTCKKLEIKTKIVLIDTFKLIITTTVISIIIFLLQKRISINSWYSFFIIGIICGIITLLINSIVVCKRNIYLVIQRIMKNEYKFKIFRSK